MNSVTLSLSPSLLLTKQLPKNARRLWSAHPFITGLRPDLVFMAITSQTRHTAGFGEIAIKEWNQAGLLRPSLMKPIFATLDKQLVLKKLGRLAPADRLTLTETLKKLLGE